MNFKEITVPVPWGHIAGKAWGDDKNPAVIALHGYQDNANSFDNLIPLLPNAFYYIAIDLPCHGKSSAIPTSTIIHLADFVFCLKLFLDKLKLKRCILIGHSFGSQTAIFFAQLYPEYVQKLISLDAIYYMPIDANFMISKLRECYDLSEKLSTFSVDTAPSYTIDEAVARLRHSRFVPITEEGARALIMRSLMPTENGKYKIVTSQQLKYASRPAFSLKYQVELIEENPIQCPHLSVGASESEIYRKMIRKVFNAFKKNKLFTFQTVTGSHDVHIEYPERVAPVVAKFLLQQNNKL